MAFIAIDKRDGGSYAVRSNFIPDNPGTLNDDFVGTGPLQPPWQFFQPDAVPDTQIRDGLFQGVITDNTGNVTLWFNQNRGRGNRQAIRIPTGPTPVEIIVENIGIGPTSDPTADMPSVGANFLFAGLLVSGTSDFNTSYFFNVVGHRSSATPATVENKGTFEGVSAVTDEGNNVFGGTTKGDLRLRIFNDGSIEYARRPNGGSTWTLTNSGTGVPPVPVQGTPRLGFAGDYIYVSLITYAQDSVNLPFVGSAERISSNITTAQDVVTNPTLGDTDSNTQVTFTFDTELSQTLENTDSNFTASHILDGVITQTLQATNSNTTASHIFDAVTNPELGDIVSNFDVTFTFDGLVNPTLGDTTSSFVAGHTAALDAVVNPVLGDSVSNFTAGHEVDAVVSQTLEDTGSNFVAGHLVDVVMNPDLGDTDSTVNTFFSFDGVINVTLGDAGSNFTAFQPEQIMLVGEIQSNNASFSGDIVSTVGEESIAGEIISGPARMEGVILTPGVSQEMRFGQNITTDRYVEIESEEFDGQ